MKKLTAVLLSCLLVFSTAVMASATDKYIYDTLELDDAVLCDVNITNEREQLYFKLCYTKDGRIELRSDDTSVKAEVKYPVKNNTVKIEAEGNFIVNVGKRSLSVSVESAPEITLVSIKKGDTATSLAVTSMLEGYAQEAVTDTVEEATAKAEDADESETSVTQVDTQITELTQAVVASDADDKESEGDNSMKILLIISIIFNVLLLSAVIYLAVNVAKMKKKMKSVMVAIKNKAKRESKASKSKLASNARNPVNQRQDNQPTIVHINSSKAVIPEALPIEDDYVSAPDDISWLDSVKGDILDAYRNGSSFNFEHYYADVDDYQTSMSGVSTVMVYDKKSTHFVLFVDGDTGKSYLLPNPCYYNSVSCKFSLRNELFKNVIVPTNAESGVIVDFIPAQVEETYRNCYSVKAKGTISWG